MAGNDADLVVRVAANISALQADMATAATSIRTIEGAVVSAHTASAGWMSSLDALGSSWVARIAEGVLLRDAIREIISKLKEMAEFLPELAMKGAVVQDVEEAFHRLSEQAGILSDTLLSTLRAGTHGTIDDFELMKRSNQDLAAGLTLTDSQFGLLAQGAYALAKATGGDTKTALDSMNDAMLTGRTRAIALLTGKIDLKEAEEDFAKSLGSTADHLTAEGKLEAARTAILAAVQGAVARLGEQTENLDDKVQQVRVAWANFEDELGKVIAQSPVIAAGFDSIRASLIAAFGGSQQEAIRQITAHVNNAAIMVVDFGIAAGGVAGAVVQVWYGIKTAILAVETAIAGLVTGIGEVLLKAEQLAGKLHIVDADEVARVKETQVALRAMTVSLAEQTAEAARGALGQSDFGKSITAGTGMLFTMRDAMVAARTAQEGHTEATRAFVGPLEQVNQGLQKKGAFLKSTAADTKILAEQEAELRRVTDEYYRVLNAADHDTTAAQIRNAYLVADEKVAALSATVKYTVEAEMMIWKAAEQTHKNIIQQNLEADINSHAHFVKIADEAEIAFKRALAAGTEFSDSYKQKLRETAEAARLAADAFGVQLTISVGQMPPKVDALTNSFKGLTVQIAASVEQMRAWSAATAHNANTGQMNGPSNVSGIGSTVGSLSFAGGSNGFQDFGSGTPAILHGREAVVREGDSLGGSTVVNVYVTHPLGTPQQIYAVIDQAITDRQRAIGTRF